MAEASPLVGIVMGSKSDLPILAEAAALLQALEIPHEVNIVSAHRTPLRMVAYAQSAEARGLRVLIAGAGGAAHLPGMLASLTLLPVIGVPVLSRNSIGGWDSLLSILQMPAGVPVATVALNGGRNAGLLAAQLLATTDEALRKRLAAHRDALRIAVEDDADAVARDGYQAHLPG